MSTDTGTAGWKRAGDVLYLRKDGCRDGSEDAVYRGRGR